MHSQMHYLRCSSSFNFQPLLKLLKKKKKVARLGWFGFFVCCFYVCFFLPSPRFFSELVSVWYNGLLICLGTAETVNS